MEVSGTTLALFTLVSGFLGVFVTSLFNHLNTRAVARSEERRHQRDLIIQSAIASWKQQMEAYAIHQRPITHLPLEVYIITMVKFSQLFLEKDFDLSTIEERMKEMRDVGREAVKHTGSNPKA